jgi:hypothetical protein
LVDNLCEQLRANEQRGTLGQGAQQFQDFFRRVYSASHTADQQADRAMHAVSALFGDKRAAASSVRKNAEA